ncbi:MAG TPA: dienelactone hydrolase family protein [Frankiaceae bacterium]|nr:dienelactone hydrolase family protein [Frankiaceae bacterium]
MTDEVSGFLLDRDAGAPWPVYTDGSGPPVLVLHELMGLTPPALAFARRVVDSGFTVYLPVLSGPAPATSRGDMLKAALGVCVSREIHLLKSGATSPIVTPLRALARYATDKAGTRGAGVVGMCFSGGFALALAADEPVLAGVAAQPSLPYAPLKPWCAGDLGLDRKDVEDLEARLATGDTGIYVARFTEDRTSPRRRLQAIKQKFGTENVTIDELPSYPDNEFGFAASDHSVLAVAPANYPAGSAAAARLEQAFGDVITFLTERLT